jgi:sigma-B regulation protein RsbU (phosphoserine phosphatase)
MQRDGQVLHFESEVRRRDGKTFWISENVRSIHDEAGNFLYYEGTVDDVTELKLAREKVQHALEEVERAQQRLESELADAATYVRTLLPEPLTGEIDVKWCYLPCSHLGGDAFGYHWLEPDMLALYLLDVSGHGVASALLSISVMNILRTQLLPGTDYRDPSSVLEGLNRAFPMVLNNEKYFTIWYGVYHQPSRTLTYASGGQHAAVLAAGDGHTFHLQSGGPVIGMMPDLKYPSAKIEVTPAAELYLFSDGVYEISLPSGGLQTWEEFLDYLKCARPDIDQIVHDMRQLHGGGEFDDDFSLLKFKFA